MAIISKFRNSNNRFGSITTDTLQLEYDLQIYTNTIDITLTNKNDDTQLFQLHLDLQKFKDNSKFSGQSWFGINNHILYENDEFISDLVTPSVIDLINLLEYSKVNKNNILVDTKDGVSASNTHLVPVRIFFPYESCDFTDCIIQVAAPEAGDLDHSVTIVTNSGNTVVEDFITWKDYFATITATGTISGDNINVTINVSEPNLEYVYLEPVVGILDRTKIKLTNGSGSFTIKTDTLSTGDTAEVKIGYKTYTNALTYTKTIE